MSLVAEGSSWMDIKNSCKHSRKRMRVFINKRKLDSKDNNENTVKLEIARSIERELKEIEEILDNKVLYSYKSLSKRDIEMCGLTERQQEVAKLMQEKNHAEVAKVLGVDRKTVFEIFNAAIKKIEKYKASENKRLISLSPQQREIYKLVKDKKTNLEIANELNTSVDNVKKQKRKIKSKLGGTKTPHK